MRDVSNEVSKSFEWLTRASIAETNRRCDTAKQN